MNAELTKALIETTARLTTEAPNKLPPHILGARAMELFRLARGLTRRAEAECSYEMSETQAARNERSDERAYTRANAIMAELGLPPVEPMSDVRGYAIKIFLPSGRSNSMGGRVWGIAS